MSKYRVFLVATATALVEVEADDAEAAIGVAFENAPAGANSSNDFDLSDWQFADVFQIEGDAS